MNPEAVEKFLKLIGDSSRLKILYGIGTGEKTVSEIIAATGLAQTLVSFHLKLLRERGIVDLTRNGGPFPAALLSAGGEARAAEPRAPNLRWRSSRPGMPRVRSTETSSSG